MSIPFGMVNLSSVGEAKVFQLPQFMHFGIHFEISACVAIGLLFAINSVQAIGDYSATTIGAMDRVPENRELTGGIVGYGISNIFCAFFGGLPTATYSQNVGIVSTTKVVSRVVMGLAATILLAAEDFRIFWDNAYCVHHLYEDKQDYLLEILMECKKAGNQDMVYKFSSTSKISFPGSGIAAIAASDANLADIRNMMKVQTIGHDKVNQLRHVRFFKDIHGIVEHMKKHADIMRPKFETVINTLERELGGLEIGSWIAPRGGYFISFDAMEGCAKAIVAKAKEAGLVMTGAGATFPYGKDPKDSNIRIAPSYPTPEELAVAAEIFVLSVKLVSIDKLLKNL